ncbi:hypothetical protein FSP39_002411 [Pinctada imbricata]|uniref:DDE Tnp4 domain-containing protein n=1 Tax=Pinctada imbricata TaxID=66713 RepID=A0AA88YAN0_PINIB|nr:hypothetical protein FSP39_002411 [Pinctada imbricata]
MDLDDTEVQIAVVGSLWVIMEEEEENMRQDAISRQESDGSRQVRSRRPHRWWVRPWLHAEIRLQYGHYHRLMEELRYDDATSFQNFLRMGPAMFDELLSRISSRITKHDTFLRRALDPGLKLAATLRHLASGDSYSSLAYDFRVRGNTISVFVPDICKAIVEEYKNEIIPCPTTQDEWLAIASEFGQKWNVPHSCGAIDGKHVAIKKPPRSGSLFYTYKGFFSIVLIGLVDANYRFLWIDVGGDGAMSDGQIFNESELKECLEDNSINLPPPDHLPNDDRNIPYFLLGDDAFALRTFMMKPYSKRQLTDEERIFNYRISRGRRVVENAFGILASRWQVLLSTMQQHPETVRLIVETCVCLHNIMRMRYPTLQTFAMDTENEDHEMVPGQWRHNRTCMIWEL